MRPFAIAFAAGALATANPAHAGRYYVDRCSFDDQLVFDMDASLVYFNMPEDQHVKWGHYLLGPNRAWMVAAFGTNPKVTLTMYPDGSVDWKDSSGKHGRLYCNRVEETDTPPSWVKPVEASATPAPSAPPPAQPPPVVADSPKASCERAGYGKACDHAVAPRQEAQPAPAPTVAAGNQDAVPIMVDRERAFASVTLGSLGGVIMLIDTGANVMTVAPQTADRLIARGEARDEGSAELILADGRRVTERLIVINKIQLGAHTLTDVEAAVTADKADELLPFSVLSRFGKFTLDIANRKLIFG